MRMVSKTTYKLVDDIDDDDDKENNNQDSMSVDDLDLLPSYPQPQRRLELMEIPLSPTNYDQPPPPEDQPPPPPQWAEWEIQKVLDQIRDVSGEQHQFIPLKSIYVISN